MPFAAGYLSSGAYAWVNMKIPVGSKITHFYIYSFQPGYTDGAFIEIQFYLGHGVYSVASITPTTHRCYLVGRIWKGDPASGVYGGIGGLVSMNPMLPSVDNDAFLCVVFTAGANITDYNIFYSVSWDLPDNKIPGYSNVGGVPVWKDGNRNQPLALKETK